MEAWITFCSMPRKNYLFQSNASLHSRLHMVSFTFIRTTLFTAISQPETFSYVLISLDLCQPLTNFEPNSADKRSTTKDQRLWNVSINQRRRIKRSNEDELRSYSMDGEFGNGTISIFPNNMFDRLLKVSAINHIVSSQMYGLMALLVR